MNKNTICALLIGTSLLACEEPKRNDIEFTGKKDNYILYVPVESKDMDCQVVKEYYTGWNLTCQDPKTGKKIFYNKGAYDEQWNRYELVPK